jgi:hypothetical protein
VTSVVDNSNQSGGCSEALADSGTAQYAKAAGRGGHASFDAARYLSIAVALAVLMLGLVAVANRRFAPEMYRPSRLAHIADVHAAGKNYAVFDLNINMRRLRDEQIKRMDHTPSVAVLGASQWQEATPDLLPKYDWFNAHVHRDYYEDVLGVVEMLTRNGRLPKELVITIRDRTFMPVKDRTDFLWLPIVPYYRDMARRLSLEPHVFWETYPFQRTRELISLPLLFANATRWYNSRTRPAATAARTRQHLDILHPDGSIRWSNEHLALFTRERSTGLATEVAVTSRHHPIRIDPKGVEAIDRLLSYLAVRGVRVHLAHPPYNPVFYERIKGSAFLESVRRVEAVTAELASRHKLNLVGSFNPADVGCTAEMFIDAEHSRAACLRKILAEVAKSIDLPFAQPVKPLVGEIARPQIRSRQTVMASGWPVGETIGVAVTSPAGHPAPQFTASASIGSTVLAAPAPLLARPRQEGLPTVPAGGPADRVVNEPVHRELTAADAPAQRAQRKVRTALPVSTRTRLRTRTVARVHRAAPRQVLIWPGDSPAGRQ